MHWLDHTIREFLHSWGYWAVLLGLLAESAGLPLPGESMLMFASFLANKEHHLVLHWIIPTGIAAAVLGDNIGFWLGRYFGRTFIRWAKKLFHLEDEDVKVAMDLLKRHGGRTIFFSRFVFGLRMIAGPLAGSLGMEWDTFLKYNVLGAATWVTIMAVTGYAFANEFQTLFDYIEKGSWGVAAGLLTLGYVIWRHQKNNYKHREERRVA
jgi:membrane-associated protein